MINARYKRESLEIVDQTQTPRYVLRFESLLHVPAFTQKDFHNIHTGPPSTEEFAIIKLGVHNSSLQHSHPTQEVRHKAKTTITSTQEG